jgi:hypothetical protein
VKRHRLITLGLLLALASALAGCGGEKVSHAPASKALAAEERAKPAKPVVTGEGLSIGLAKFEHFLRENPELTKPEALDQLVDRELLANEALERGLENDPTLASVRKRAMVRELLRAKVEDEITAEDLDADEIAGVVEQIRREVGHPPGVRASHLVVLIPPEKKKGASKKQIEAWFEQSRTWLDRLIAELPDTELPDGASALDLLVLQEAYKDKLPEPLKPTVNAHMLFPAAPMQEYGGDLPETWQPVVPEFREAAAELARQGRFGELSEPVKTEFGWHVIVAEEALPGKLADADDLREVARWRLLRHKRNSRLTELVREWAEDAQMQTFPEVITEAEELNN